jgi:hypothetical protein
VPFVSGISALLIQNNRTGFEIKQILMDNAEDLGFDVNAQGAGLVDAYAAFTYNFTGNVSGKNETTKIEIGGVEVPPGNSVIYNFTVENLGETPDTFGIYSEGVPSGWVNIPAALTVDARKAVSGRAVITIPDNLAITENASYNLTIYAVGRSRDKETGSVTVLATKQSVKNYAVNEIRNLKTEIGLYINAPKGLNESGECVNEYGINGQKFGEEITKKLDKAADSINKDEPLKAGEILTEISNELSKEKGRKISNEFAEYLIAKIEDMKL